eukprot:10929293-Karenia_brevis.AAC.1
MVITIAIINNTMLITIIIVISAVIFCSLGGPAWAGSVAPVQFSRKPLPARKLARRRRPGCAPEPPSWTCAGR